MLNTSVPPMMAIRAVANAEFGERLFERRADGIPKQRVGVRWIGRDVRDLAGHHQTLAPRRVRAAFVRMSAVHDRGGLVEAGLKEFLVCIVDVLRPA